jgi:PhzF family phenazine biosynthesis protein
MTDVDVLRMAVFTDNPQGGNPAGVVLDAGALTDAEMLRIAADVDYSETAFVTDRTGDAEVTLRFFSPYAEVPFCGHATLGTAVALAERASGEEFYTFSTKAGLIRIRTRRTDDGLVEASFTSIDPVVSDLDPDVLDRLLGLLTVDGRTVDRSDLAKDYPPRLSNAGNPHPVVVFRDQAVFDALTFDPAQMRELMDEQRWTGTVTLLLPTDDGFHARNPFPVGRITEDPATGSAAASTGAYLRELGELELPARVTIHQGEHVGRPGILRVDIPLVGGITVSGTAVELPAAV